MGSDLKCAGKNGKYQNAFYPNMKAKMKNIREYRPGGHFGKFKPIPFHMKSYRNRQLLNPFLANSCTSRHVVKKKCKSFSFGKLNEHIRFQGNFNPFTFENNFTRLKNSSSMLNASTTPHTAALLGYANKRPNIASGHSSRDLSEKAKKGLYRSVHLNELNLQNAKKYSKIPEMSQMSFKADTKINGISF